MARDNPTIFPLSLVVCVVSVPVPLFKGVGIDRDEDVTADKVEERAVAAKDVTDAAKDLVGTCVAPERIDDADDIGESQERKNTRKSENKTV